jgi:cytochrome P450
LGGYWVVTSPDYISEALHTPAIFSSWTLQLPKPASFPVPMIPSESDEPEHKKYRSLLNGPLSRRAVAPLGDNLRRSAIQLITDIIPRGECDFVSELAQKFPVRAFLGLYGLPLEDAANLIVWSHMIFHQTDVKRREEGVRLTYAYLQRISEDRKANPRDDLVTHLVHGKIDGAPLAPDALLGMLFTTLSAGLDTVAETMSFATRHLAKHPEHRRQLVDNPALIPEAMEELMRRYGVIHISRIAKTDFTFKGLEIKKDDQFLLPLALLGFDDASVPQPLSVDFQRSVRNPAFGLGIHRCVGSHLARLELQIFFEEWLRLLPEFGIRPGVIPEVGVGNVIIFVKNLPLVWKPARAS